MPLPRTESETEPGVLALEELLAPYREDESLERFVCLIDDLDAMRVCALWPNVSKAWSRPRRPMPSDPNERWAWLWEGVQFDDESFAEMVDLRLSRLWAKITMLASARILFPDGTVPRGARGVLHGVVGGRIKTSGRKRGGA